MLVCLLIAFLPLSRNIKMETLPELPVYKKRGNEKLPIYCHLISVLFSNRLLFSRFAVMLCQVQLVVVVLSAMLCVLAQGFAVCPECVNGKYDCQSIYPRCGPKVDHLCFTNGVYYCAQPKTCPECSVPGFKCVNRHPFCNKETTTGLCYQDGQFLCLEKILPTTKAAPTTLPTTPKPTTPAPTTVAPTTVTPTTVTPTTVDPRDRCLTPGLISGCLLQCPPTWIPLIGKICLEGTCCTKLP